MEHLAYCDTKAKELENLLNGSQTAIIRGAAGKKIPHGVAESARVRGYRYPMRNIIIFVSSPSLSGAVPRASHPRFA